MNFSRRIKVLIASADQAASEFMQSSLSALSQYDSEVKDHGALLDKRMAVDPASYDLLVLDAGDGALLESTVAQELRRKFAALPLIVVSDPLTDQRMRLLLKLNGSDWMRKPLDRKSFLEAVTGNVQMAHSGGNHVHAVVSAVGGAGGTSVAISLADALSRTAKKTQVSVALFDLDFATGACGHYLNTPNDYDLRPIIAQPSRVDLEFIDIIKKKHQRGFSLLSFRQPGVTMAPTGGELVLRMLDVVSLQNNHTVVDIPYYETSWKDELLAAVNSVHLVTELTIPGLQQAKEVYNRIKKLRSDDIAIKVIANKHRRRLFSFGIGKKDANNIFKQSSAMVVEDDWGTMNEAINRGMLPAEVNPRSKFVRQIEKLAEAVK
ncbi:pilus assembly protein [Mesorhizobium sp. M0589]|uniref:pilus assembly protein n=1 Tax=Mesorhizobium sp. M0589 TaxID=2956965 RepID=UPI00333CBCC3